MSVGKFGTAINCIDGRVQIPVTMWMKEYYRLDYIDMITEPGPDKLLAAEHKEVDSIKNRVMISVKAHGSSVILIAGHHDCAGNPVEADQHKTQLKTAVQAVRSWDLPVNEIIGVWVNRNWQIEVVSSSK